MLPSKERTGVEMKASRWAPAAFDVAAASAFLEMGDRLGILRLLDESGVTADHIASSLGLPSDKVDGYLTALLHAGLLERADGQEAVRPVPEFAKWRHDAGSVSWAMNANRPFVEHAREFFVAPDTARREHPRDLRQAAIATQWVGALDVYPTAFRELVSRRPRRCVDLGAGTGRLLIDVLRAVDGATGVALDIDAAVCADARSAALSMGVGERMTVVEQAIETLADDPSILTGSDVIHAGFVLHDMFPGEEGIADRVLANCYRELRSGGAMVVAELMPYVENPRERAFSALITYCHQEFMGIGLQNEREWSDRLRRAGFDGVRTEMLDMPTSRLFVATKS
jgi:SAM-dependent methyltransferase